MIKYDRFWVTMKKRGISQYDLYEHYADHPFTSGQTTKK